MHAIVLTLALLALLCLPCAVAMVICADELLDGAAWRLAQWRERRTLERLERALGSGPVAPDTPPADTPRPSIGQIAADLRRLDLQRLGVGSRSPVWHAAVLRAYDDQLRLACRCLGVTEHLGELTSVDLEIERVRVEGALHEAGLVLRVDQGRRQDHW